MTYRGEVKKYPPLGIKPTQEDRDLVRALSLLGIGVREICVRLGDRLKLGKPMSRLSLYHHFRKELVPRKKGASQKASTVRRRVMQNIGEEMQRLINEAKARRG